MMAGCKSQKEAGEGTMGNEGRGKRKGDTLPVCSSPLASSRTDARAENRKSNKSDLFLLPSCVCWLANDEGGQARPARQAGIIPGMRLW